MALSRSRIFALLALLVSNASAFLSPVAPRALCKPLTRRSSSLVSRRAESDGWDDDWDAPA
eukprot:CAMPEP_0205927462 /NCGR_PEP_ID=MMETSP1325-20131115/22645_1 /ASSEMBLY_ACC=CAM_ASM_000708 /TAXON_ID=236786 /ORGANISM="Florenciella sp., Strain RCC1007" /LENGTH=60 /DNA_ID=CAMNT_0053296343 /DNA_START=35 /DNA_END=214 /DNA_ORIENTATION=-